MRSLSIKLIVAFLIVSLMGTLLVAVYVAFRTTTRFGEFVVEQYYQQLSTRFVEYYRANGSWQGVAENVHVAAPEWGFGSDPKLPRPPDIPADVTPQPRERMNAFVLADSTGRVVVPGLGHRVGQQVRASDVEAGLPLVVDGTRVGTLITTHGAPWENPTNNRFLQGFYGALAVGGLGATLIALTLGVWLARSITRPVREMTDATIAMSQGDLAQKIPIRSRDELGNLASSFNQMSAQLAQAENLRRQMTADIAHELRTPLSLILGHAEALSDGVLPPSPETFAIIQEEAQRLAHQVEDLRTLSVFDAGEPELHREPTDPGPFLASLANSYQPRALARQVALGVDSAPDAPWMDIDPDRLLQVLRNLLDNALRHTPEGGRIVLAAQREPGDHAAPRVRLTVRDTGPGISPDELAHVFERFYRADKSRHRPDNGGNAESEAVGSGSGLGLAIARAIVEAHGGRIWAESALGQGAAFHITLRAA